MWIGKISVEKPAQFEKVDTLRLNPHFVGESIFQILWIGPNDKSMLYIQNWVISTRFYVDIFMDFEENFNTMSLVSFNNLSTLREILQ